MTKQEKSCLNSLDSNFNIHYLFTLRLLDASLGGYLIDHDHD